MTVVFHIRRPFCHFDVEIPFLRFNYFKMLEMY